MRFFEFSRWPPPQSWIFENVKFYSILGSRVARRISVPNFVKNRSIVCEDIKIFRFFKMAAVAILYFRNRGLLFAGGMWMAQTHHCTKNCRNRSLLCGDQHAKFCQNRSIGCEDIKIFQFFKMAAVRHLGFVWGIFGQPTVSTWGSLSLCKIWL